MQQIYSTVNGEVRPEELGSSGKVQDRSTSLDSHNQQVPALFYTWEITQRAMVLSGCRLCFWSFQVAGKPPLPLHLPQSPVCPLHKIDIQFLSLDE